MERDRRRKPLLDLAVAFLTLWIACGFFLDAWAHGHVPIETFFTPYHGVFYAGLFLLAIVLATYAFAQLRQGIAWNDVFPRTYRVPLLGIPIFLASGVGDLLWHRWLGVEEGVDALLSPTHQGLGLGVFFLATAPILSVLRARPRGLAAQLPLVLALAAWIELVHFGTAYAFDPAAGFSNAPPPLDGPRTYFSALAFGYYKLSMGVLVVLFQSGLIAGFALFALRAAPAFGFYTLLYPLGNFAAAAAFTNDTPLLAAVLVASIVAGVIADVLLARFHPTPRVPLTFRAFAIAVPLAYFTVYFVVTAIVQRIWWDWNVVLGALCWSAVIGLGLSFLIPASRWMPEESRRG